jgi:hypothetical protein
MLQHTSEIFKKSDALLRARSSAATGPTITYALSLLYLLHLPCDSRKKSPTHRFACCGLPCRPPASSFFAVIPPSRVESRHICCHVVPGPRPYAPCPVPHHIEVLPTPPFPTRRSWPLSTPVPPRHSTSAHDITRLLWLHLALSYFLGVASLCCKRMFQVFHVDVAKLDRDVAYVASVCSKCFICFRRMLHVFYLGVMFHTLCCKCFIRMLHMFSHICCKCFI